MGIHIIRFAQCRHEMNPSFLLFHTLSLHGKTFVYRYNLNNAYICLTTNIRRANDTGVGLLLTMKKNRHKEHQHINAVGIQLNMVAVPITNAIQLMHPVFHKKTLAMCTESIR